MPESAKIYRHRHSLLSRLPGRFFILFYDWSGRILLWVSSRRSTNPPGSTWASVFSPCCSTAWLPSPN